TERSPSRIRRPATFDATAFACAGVSVCVAPTRTTRLGPSNAARTSPSTVTEQRDARWTTTLTSPPLRRARGAAPVRCDRRTHVDDEDDRGDRRDDREEVERAEDARERQREEPDGR